MMPTFSVPSVLLLPGTWSFGPFSLVSGSRVNLLIPRDPSWVGSDGSEIASVDTEISLDAGQTWRHFYGFGIADDGPMMPAVKGNPAIVPLAASGINNQPIETPCLLRGALFVSKPITIGFTAVVT